MQFFAPPASAEAWQDRSPLSVNAGAAGSLNNDTAGTVRWTYTVPAGRRAFIGAYFASAYATVPGVGDVHLFTIAVIPSGGAEYAIYRTFKQPELAASEGKNGNGTGVWMAAGDVIHMTTVTINATGTTIYTSGMSGLEFDA
jgi:hypothetical protein